MCLRAACHKLNKYYDLARNGDSMAVEHYPNLEVKADAECFFSGVTACAGQERVEDLKFLDFLWENHLIMWEEIYET